MGDHCIDMSGHHQSHVAMVRESDRVWNKKITSVRKQYTRIRKSIKGDVVFLLWCVVAVMLDPLFFYIPLINEDKKCLGVDRDMRRISIILRSITDLAFVINIFVTIRSGFSDEAYGSSKKSDSFRYSSSSPKKKFSEVMKNIRWGKVIIDVLAILPIPQVAMTSIFFHKMKGSESLNARKWLNFFLLVQYVPRVLFRIYLPYKKLIEDPDYRGLIGNAWMKGGFNFFLYVLASHVLGAFWYLFSIERETSCWHNACKERNDCLPTTFYCDSISESENNHTFLNHLCPLHPPNPAVFDFGIFVAALQPGIVGSTDFPRKLLNCFSWGLRNLSSFGSNLQTSTNAWENIFVGCITIIGLLLFLYLIGNLQVYMSLGATRAEDARRKKRIEAEKRIHGWFQKNGIELEDAKKKHIVELAKGKLVSKKGGVDVKTLLPILPLQLQKRIKQHLCLETLKKVPALQNMTVVLGVFIEHLKPVNYSKGKIIVEKGKPLNQMILFTHGTVTVVSSTSTKIKERAVHPASSICTSCIHDHHGHERLGKGCFHGEELLEWALSNPISPTDHHGHNLISTSTKTLKARTKVEALVLEMDDINNLITNFWWLIKTYLPRPYTLAQAQRSETKAAFKLQAAWQRRSKSRFDRQSSGSSSSSSLNVVAV